MAPLGFALDASSAVDLGADAAVRADPDDVSVGSPAATRRPDLPLQRDPRGHHNKEGDARKDDGADHEPTYDRFANRYTYFDADHSPDHGYHHVGHTCDTWTCTDRNRHHACPGDNLIVLPRGVLHAYAVTSPRARMLCFQNPGSGEAFYLDASEGVARCPPSS